MEVHTSDVTYSTYIYDVTVDILCLGTVFDRLIATAQIVAAL